MILPKFDRFFHNLGTQIYDKRRIDKITSQSFIIRWSFKTKCFNLSDNRNHAYCIHDIIHHIHSVWWKLSVQVVNDRVAVDQIFH